MRLLSLTLAASLATFSYSLSTIKKNAVLPSILHEKREITRGANILYSLPANGDTFAGFAAFSYRQKSASFVASEAYSVITILVRHDPGYFYYDDFKLVRVGSNDTSIIENPGFETGVLYPWVMVGIPGLPAGGNIRFGTAHSGSWSFMDGAVGGVDGISQIVPTVPGATYVLTFWLQCTGVSPGSGALTQVLQSSFLSPLNLTLEPHTDSGRSQTDGITNIRGPDIQGNVAPRQVVYIYLNGNNIGNTVSTQSGDFLFQMRGTTAALVPGQNRFEATTAVGNLMSRLSDPLLVTYIPHGTELSILLSASSLDSISGNITSTRNSSPTVIGVGEPNTLISLYNMSVNESSTPEIISRLRIRSTSTLLGTTTTDSDGSYSFTIPNLDLGIHIIIAEGVPDIAGNLAIPASLRIIILPPQHLSSSSSTFSSSSTSIVTPDSSSSSYTSSATSSSAFASNSSSSSYTSSATSSSAFASDPSSSSYILSTTSASTFNSNFSTSSYTSNTTSTSAFTSKFSSSSYTLSTTSTSTLTSDSSSSSFTPGGISTSGFASDRSSSSSTSSAISTSTFTLSPSSPFYAKNSAISSISITRLYLNDLRPTSSAIISFPSTIQAFNPEFTTSTVYETITKTITRCLAAAVDCPARSQYIQVVTLTTALYTTVCPVAALALSSKTVVIGTAGTPETRAPIQTPSPMAVSKGQGSSGPGYSIQASSDKLTIPAAEDPSPTLAHKPAVSTIFALYGGASSASNNLNSAQGQATYVPASGAQYCRVSFVWLVVGITFVLFL